MLEGTGHREQEVENMHHDAVALACASCANALPLRARPPPLAPALAPCAPAGAGAPSPAPVATSPAFKKVFSLGSSHRPAVLVVVNDVRFAALRCRRLQQAVLRIVDDACARRGRAFAVAIHAAVHSEGETTMLRIYDTMMHALTLLRPVIEQVERSDRDLGNQLRRCASSVALNMAEASGSRGGNRNVRYRSALGSARETSACIDVAVALGYVEPVDDELRACLTSVQHVLVKIVA
jgi:four helix bundle protein